MTVRSKSNSTATMSSFKPIFLFVFFNFLHFSTTTAAEDPVFLGENCTSTETFTANSAFQLNLKTLLSSLSSHATPKTEFYSATVADKTPSETVYGLFMCRGDVPPDLCRKCVLNAIQRLGAGLSNTCPFSKGAVIWYDECMVRYSNRYFFSTMDTRPRMQLRNTTNVTTQARESFMRLLYTTLKDTSDEAAKSPTGFKKYATKHVKFSAFQTLYSMTQCTPDLSPQDCRRCLSFVLADVPWCCTYRIGGRVLYPSCNFRYELYPFYREASTRAATSARKKGKRRTSKGIIIAIVVPIIVAVLLFAAGICFLRKRARKKHDSVPGEKAVTVNDSSISKSLQFGFSTIEAATNKFSVANKLGEGGFGEVYEGALPSGQEVAAKWLSKSSGQSAEEFKNEVVLVASLQHRNLERLLGFCLEGEEKIIYEFVPNKSLDYVLFDPDKKRELNWTNRFKIIRGVAQCILYLHEDAKLDIIHCDLKASNAMLNVDVNPRISDVGTIKIFGVDPNEGDTRGTNFLSRYMSSEYAMHGEYSIKSDVYSFGVLVLEIISGKKNNSYFQNDKEENLLSYAWKLWKDAALLEMSDPSLRESYTPTEVVRCIHIGLLCVQDDPANRPTMASIVHMLDDLSVTVPAPKQPAKFLHSGTDLNMPTELQLGQPSSITKLSSVNEISVSEVNLDKPE